MKKLIIAAFLVVGVASFAQNNNDRPQRGDFSPEKRIERLTTQLNLDAKQQEQVKQIYAEQAKNREAQKGFSREQMQEERKKSDEKLKAILTPEQLKKWEANQAEMRQRMGNRQGGGMGDRPQGGNMEN
jgi:protein CpxP